RSSPCSIYRVGCWSVSGLMANAGVYPLPLVRSCGGSTMRRAVCSAARASFPDPRSSEQDDPKPDYAHRDPHDRSLAHPWSCLRGMIALREDFRGSAVQQLSEPTERACRYDLRHGHAERIARALQITLVYLEQHGPKPTAINMLGGILIE